MKSTTISSHTYDIPLSFAPFYPAGNLLRVAQEHIRKGDYTVAYELLQDLESRSETGSANACKHLAIVCEKMDRPIGCLGYMLRAKRLGADICETEISRLRQRIYRINIEDEVTKSPYDCFVLGRELSYQVKHSEDEAFHWATFFLESATTTQNGNSRAIAGLAALELAQLYAAHAGDEIAFKKERDKFFSIAKELGNPEFLTKGGI